MLPIILLVLSRRISLSVSTSVPTAVFGLSLPLQWSEVLASTLSVPVASSIDKLPKYVDLKMTAAALLTTLSHLLFTMFVIVMGPPLLVTISTALPSLCLTLLSAATPLFPVVPSIPMAPFLKK